MIGSFRISTPTSAAYRRGKLCPICGEKNFSRLSHHLAVTHNLDRQEILTLLAYTDQNNNTNNTNPSIASVSGSSPTNTPSNAPDKSPQQTPISINTNNQQITCPSSPISESDNHSLNQPSLTTTTSSSPLEQQSANYLPIDGKKRLLCPRCDTWVLNLTDHLIKKHHLISKQERLPFLRLARNRYATPSSTPTTLVNGNEEKTSSNSFLISPDQHSSINTNHQSSPLQQNPSLLQQAANRKYQNIVKKYRKKHLNSIPIPSANHSATSSLTNANSTDKSTFDPTNLSLSAQDLSLAANHNLLTMNSIQSLLTNGCKQEKFKFPNLNENFSSRNFPPMKGLNSTNPNLKDPQQVRVLSSHIYPFISLLLVDYSSKIRTTSNGISSTICCNISHAKFSNATNGIITTKFRLY